ncbi:serine/threonine protein kinase [Actinophytocola glycyrrhizae]|uniref:non-specific serine/threonine protein kinase n=1 Tax=Actinophytocola glycyrrhizae TaxID=2044873 RepID=A0ABV9SEE8_9PSEU
MSGGDTVATIDSAGLHRVDDGPVATVYSGQRAGLPVVWKVFPKRLDKRTMAAFNKEQAKLSTVRRVTSILPVAGVDELDTGESAVRMERCTQSLAALVERVGPLPPADVVVLGRAVAVALAAAHGAGVVHGGVSPHNILFRTTGEPVLADLGVTLRQAFARDPLYAIEFLPPETLRTGVLNEDTDLYGLGAVLHYALSGRSPHPGRLGEQPGERVLRILGAPVPAINNPDVPIGLSTLVARLLAADPARRLGDASAVAGQLGAMLPGSPQRPAADDFDDFGASRPAPMPPTGQAPPPPPVASLPAVGDDFDDFAYPGPPAPPAYRPAVAPRPVGPPPVARAPAVAPPVVQPPVPPPVAAEPPAEQTSPGVPAPPALPLATLTPAPTEPPAASPGAASLAGSPSELPPAPSAPPSEPPTAALPTPATVEFRAQPRSPAVRHDLDFDDDFAGVAGPRPGRGQVKVLAGPLPPPGQGPRKLLRYDLLAGAALLLALLALVPLLLFRGEPEEISSVPQLPSDGGGSTGKDVEIELAEPVELTDKVRLNWTAPEELDFIVVVAAEGKDRRYEPAERDLSMTLPVEDGLKYCFQVQASDGNDVYESNVVALRNAVCRE